MKISGIEKLSLVDFDGYVSSTIFTGGCNFKCPFCHNAILVEKHEEIPEYSKKEIFDFLRKRQGIIEAVCISGGEPTLQKDLPQFCEEIKTLGYKIKLDTNGTNFETVKSLYQNGLIDYLAVDIKNDKQNYNRTIGKDFDLTNVEKTVDFLINNNIYYEFRTTLVKEYHKKENMLNIACWIKGAKKYFLQKFKDSENCISRGLSPVDEETATEFLYLLREFIPNTFLRGYDNAIEENKK